MIDQVNMLSMETISRRFKMLSFIPFELIEVQTHFQLSETSPQSVQTTLKLTCLSNINYVKVIFAVRSISNTCIFGSSTTLTQLFHL